MLNIKLIDKLSFAIKTIKNKLMKKEGYEILIGNRRSHAYI